MIGEKVVKAFDDDDLGVPAPEASVNALAIYRAMLAQHTRILLEMQKESAAWRLTHP